jgi:hypothetical protein
MDPYPATDAWRAPSELYDESGPDPPDIALQDRTCVQRPSADTRRSCRVARCRAIINTGTRCRQCISGTAPSLKDGLCKHHAATEARLQMQSEKTRLYHRECGRDKVYFDAMRKMIHTMDNAAFQSLCFIPKERLVSLTDTVQMYIVRLPPVDQTVCPITKTTLTSSLGAVGFVLPRNEPGKVAHELLMCMDKTFGKEHLYWSAWHILRVASERLFKHTKPPRSVRVYTMCRHVSDAIEAAYEAAGLTIPQEEVKGNDLTVYQFVQTKKGRWVS